MKENPLQEFPPVSLQHGSEVQHAAQGVRVVCPELAPVTRRQQLPFAFWPEQNIFPVVIDSLENQQGIKKKKKTSANGSNKLREGTSGPQQTEGGNLWSSGRYVAKPAHRKGERVKTNGNHFSLRLTVHLSSRKKKKKRPDIGSLPFSLGPEPMATNDNQSGRLANRLEPCYVDDSILREALSEQKKITPKKMKKTCTVVIDSPPQKKKHILSQWKFGGSPRLYPL